MNLNGNYKIVITKGAQKDKEKIKAIPALKNNVDGLLEILRTNPFQNPPPYEGLVGNLNGYYSRRINIQHRLVYQVYSEPVVVEGIEYEGTIKIVRMWSHYDAVR